MIATPGLQLRRWVQAHCDNYSYYSTKISLVSMNQLEGLNISFLSMVLMFPWIQYDMHVTDILSQYVLNYLYYVLILLLVLHVHFQQPTCIRQFILAVKRWTDSQEVQGHHMSFRNFNSFIHLTVLVYLCQGSKRSYTGK